MSMQRNYPALMKSARERNRKKLVWRSYSMFLRCRRNVVVKIWVSYSEWSSRNLQNLADEVVQDFLESLEEHWEWLSLRHIRDQLSQGVLMAPKRYALWIEKSPVFAPTKRYWHQNVENFTECFEWQQLLVVLKYPPELPFSRSLYYHPARHTHFAADWGFLHSWRLSSQMLICLPPVSSNSSSIVLPF